MPTQSWTSAQRSSLTGWTRDQSDWIDGQPAGRTCSPAPTRFIRQKACSAGSMEGRVENFGRRSLPQVRFPLLSCGESVAVDL